MPICRRTIEDAKESNYNEINLCSFQVVFRTICPPEDQINEIFRFCRLHSWPLEFVHFLFTLLLITCFVLQCTETQQRRLFWLTPTILRCDWLVLHNNSTDQPIFRRTIYEKFHKFVSMIENHWNSNAFFGRSIIPPPPYYYDLLMFIKSEKQKYALNPRSTFDKIFTSSSILLLLFFSLLRYHYQ